MKMTARDLLSLRVVDRVIEEPAGGAHQDPDLAARFVGQAISETLRELLRLTPDELADDRYKRFRSLGAFTA
jgi:acetyl-CoA carboxylase carboxyl transferase subunit alpha